ncbi:MAG: NAD(P)-dependent oxidoreductase, partial [Nanoarchaeota archaeon]
WIITGALGYIGFKICELLKFSTDIIIAIDNNFCPSRVKDLVEWRILYYQLDLFSIKHLLEKADYCIHCAGITDVPSVLSQATPQKDAEIVRVGVEGTREIIQHTPKECKIIFLSTHVVYEGLKEEVLDIKEDYQPCPILAYSVSKHQSEIDLKNSNKDYIIARLGSVYGWPATRWKIIVNLFAKMTALDGELKIFGGNCIKPIVGITDVARCLIFLTESDFSREIFHIVNENIRIKDIALICKELSSKLKITEIDSETPNNGYSISNEKILKSGFIFEQNVRSELSYLIRCWTCTGRKRLILP